MSQLKCIRIYLHVCAVIIAENVRIVKAVEKAQTQNKAQ